MNTESNSAHVVDDAVDYVAGRLGFDRQAEIERHLEGCAECAAHFAFVRELERDVLAAGARHPLPERLVALAEDASGQRTAAEREHLDACASCREELTWAMAAPPLRALEAEMAADAPMKSTAEEPVDVAGRRPRHGAGESAPTFVQALAGWFRRPALGWSALGLAVAAVALIVLMRPPDPAARLAASLRIDPLPTDQVTRGGAAPAEARILYGQAMGAYARRDYEQAAELFGRLTSIAPEDAAGFLYLGSAQVLRGRPADGVPPLRTAASLAGSSRVGEESRWRLAEACVLLRDLPAARRELQAVIALDSDRRANAEALLRKIEE